MTNADRHEMKRFTGLALGLIAFLLFAQSIGHDFVNFDDHRILLEHPELYNQPNFGDGLKEIVFEAYPREEPLILRDISWALDSRLFGFDNPRGYHAVNVVLHALVVLLLFQFLYCTTRRYAFALLTTAGYLILAVHVEPVAWVMGRKDVLSTLFALCTLLSYQRLQEADSRPAAITAYVLSMAFLLCGLMSKINLVVLPGVLFLYGSLYPYLSGRSKPSAALPSVRLLLRQLCCVLPHLVLSAAAFKWYKTILDSFGLLDRGYTASGLEHARNLLLINPLVFLAYLKKLFVGHDLALLYGWPSLDGPFQSYHGPLAGMVLLAVLVVGVWLLVRRKDLFFYYASFFILMVPYMNLTYIGIWMADRYLYLASFCLIAIAADLFLTARSSARPVLRIAAMVAAVVFALSNIVQQLTYQRAWANSETLWMSNMSHPDAPIYVYNSLAQYYFTEARDATDLAQKQVLIRKAETVIDGAFDLYWADRGETPPGMLNKLFFLQALVQQIKGAPLEEQLASLEMAATLQPTFDAPRWHLAMFYYDEALRATSQLDRERHARRSIGYYKEFMSMTYRGVSNRAKVDAELADYARDFPFLAAEVEKLR